MLWRCQSAGRHELFDHRRDSPRTNPGERRRAVELAYRSSFDKLTTSGRSASATALRVSRGRFWWNPYDFWCLRL